MTPSRLPATVGSWVVPTLLIGLYALAGAVNGRELLAGVRPSMVGVVGSALYLAVWLVHAVRAGLRSGGGDLRRMAMVWAVVVAGTWLCSTFVRLDLGPGAAIPGGLVVPVLLLVLAAPAYGLVVLLPGAPLSALIPVVVGAALLTMASAIAARRLAGPAASPRAGLSRG